jgi:CubicO group peptidase (beta-lactamase class C family)
MLNRLRRASVTLWVVAATVGCSDSPATPRTPPVANDPHLQVSTAHAEGMDGERLVALANWVRDNASVPIFSILVTRHDKLVFELYTPGIVRSDAHYMMSVTKSVLSSLVGVALKTGAITSIDAPVSQLLPRGLFASDADVARFGAIRLREAMGMSALNVKDPPRDTSAAAVQRFLAFNAAPNRVSFALREPLLATPGQDFLYNDETPLITAGVVQYATGKRLLDFGCAALFDSLGFENTEWMHQDATGIDMGGYGFRMRPVDMQKLGLLYLRGGLWKGRQLLPSDWVARAFTPYMKSQASLAAPNYGWFWWTYDLGLGADWKLLVADGWRGQRIAVNREHDLVVTMTGDILQQNEALIFFRVMTDFVVPAIQRGSTRDVQSQIDAALAQVRSGAPRFAAGVTEPRMIPSNAPKERPISFQP